MERTAATIPGRWAWVACAAVALIALLVNPVGYFGGGGDDYHYLEAARCWVAAGEPCQPANHWAARWPVVAPIALLSSWFGESRATVGLGALASWIAAVALLGWLGRLWVDRTTGVIAAAVLATTPVVTRAALQPAVDLTELALQLAALVAATLAMRRQSVPAAVLAGVFAAIAVQARETSLLFCAVAAAAWLVLDRERRGVLLWAIAGFAAAMAIEMATYGWATGDPLHRYRLSLGHVAIPSEELPAGFDTSQSPLFNPAYIASWRPEAGVDWWWPLDPWLNLLLSPGIGLVLVGTMLLGLGYWRQASQPVRRLLALTSAAAMLVAVLLVYALAVDPKSRMFHLLAANASLVIGAFAAAATRAGRGLPAQLLVIALVAIGIFTLSRATHTREFEALASRWMDRHPGEIAIDRGAISTLALVPDIGSLPVHPAGRRYLLVGGEPPCSDHPGRPVAQSAVHGDGQLCLMDLGGVAARP